MIVTDPRKRWIYEEDGAKFTLAPLSAADRAVLLGAAKAEATADVIAIAAQRRVSFEAAVETCRRALRGWEGIQMADGAPLAFKTEDGSACASHESVGVLSLGTITRMFGRIAELNMATTADVGKP